MTDILLISLEWLQEQQLELLSKEPTHARSGMIYALGVVEKIAKPADKLIDKAFEASAENPKRFGSYPSFENKNYEEKKQQFKESIKFEEI